mgnify:CR=1 FL=1
MGYALKKAAVGTGLLALGVAFERVSKLADELKAELREWKDGLIVSVGALPNGPAISFLHEGGQLRYLGKGHHPDAELTVHFKNIDSAFLLVAGLMPPDTGYAQHRGILHGNVAQAMQLSRAMNIVQVYLLPGAMVRRNLKRPPVLTPAQRALKARILATLAFHMLANCLKKVPGATPPVPAKRG